MTASLPAPGAAPIVVRARPGDADVARLLAANAALSAALYPVEGNFALDPHEFDKPGAHVLVARAVDGEALGCVGMIERSDAGMPGWGEMKSFFVSPAARGLKLGLRLLDGLERHARGLGLAAIRLETGPLNEAAVTLYRRCGYVDRPAFAPYVEGPYSMFMEKPLWLQARSGS